MAHTKEQLANISMTTDTITKFMMDVCDGDVCVACVLRNVLGSTAATMGANGAGDLQELQQLVQIVVDAYNSGVMAIKDPDNVSDNVRIFRDGDPAERPI